MALLAIKSRCARRRQIAVRKPRVGDESKRCSEIVLVARSCFRRSGKERLLAFLRSLPAGRIVGSVRRVSVTQAMRSRVHLTEPVRALITSANFVRRKCRTRQDQNVPGSSSGEVRSLFSPRTFMFAAIVTSTTIFRSCRTSHENLPANVLG